MIVCVKCSRQMRPKKNGVDVTELAKLSGKGEEVQPYKVFHGDLWECQDCGTEVVYVDHRQSPVRSNFQPGFDELAFRAPYMAKEWTR